MSFPMEWQKVLKLHADCVRSGRTLSRIEIRRALNVSEFRARFLHEALTYRRTICGKGDIEGEVRLQESLKMKTKKLADAHKEIKKLARQVELHTSLAEQRLDISKMFSPGRKSGTAIATAMLNDTHFDEFVNPAEIGYVNGFGREIGDSRLEKYFNSVVRLGRDYFSGIKIEGLVFALAGDMVSGVIHEELKGSNCFPVSETIVHYAAKIISGILLLLEQYKEIFVPCVVGNHGRFSPKISYKGAVQDNFDYMLYCWIAKAFQDNKHVNFYIPIAPDAYYPVYNTKYCLTHGSQFRGGNGWAGPLMPVMKGDTRKKERQQSVNRPYDILACGHFHTQRFLGRSIMSGSLIGYNEYASGGNLTFEEPRQAFWLTDSDKGVTMTAPIHCKCDGEPWENIELENIGFQS